MIQSAEDMSWREATGERVLWKERTNTIIMQQLTDLCQLIGL